MSRRIEIELTSALDDGTFTWRAAGAKQPKGVVANTVLPDGAKIGDQYRVEVEQTIDGIDITSVIQDRQRVEKAESLVLLPTEKEFKPVLETRAPGRRRRDGDGKGRRRRDGESGDRPRRDDRDGGDRPRRDRDRGPGGRGDRNRGPRHTPPPEVPTRPKPKRLKPGKAHRNEVLAQLPEEQRPIAELTLQGMPAVRQRLKEENDRAASEGRPTMPEASVMQMAESLLPKLRVAEWLDRADAAKRQLATLDLRDLRSVVAAASDPAVARDESTRGLAEELKAALASKQEEELVLWYGDIDASLAVGRVIRALRLSAQPPKAGVPFPVDIAERLTLSTNAALTPVERPDRWVATLEAAAFSPIHAQVAPLGRPEQMTDELTATVTRLAPALPQVAEAFGITVDPEAPFPKPLRPDYAKRRKERKPGSDDDSSSNKRRGDRPDGRGGKDRPRGDRPRSADAGDAKSGDAKSGDAKSSDKQSGDAKSSGGGSDQAKPADDHGGANAVADAPSGDDTNDQPDAVADLGQQVEMRQSPSDVAEADEAESIAEAAVVAEAEALTEAASEVTAEGGSSDDMEEISEVATEILEHQSDAEVDQAATDAIDSDTPTLTVDESASDESTGTESAGDQSAGDEQASEAEASTEPATDESADSADAADEPGDDTSDDTSDNSGA